MKVENNKIRKEKKTKEKKRKPQRKEQRKRRRAQSERKGPNEMRTKKTMSEMMVTTMTKMPVKRPVLAWVQSTEYWKRRKNECIPWL